MHELQANIEVYGSNSALVGANPANVDLAIRYIDRSLEYFPENPKYLNLKALLLAEGKGMKVEAKAMLEKAHALNPRDINIENNLSALKSGGCFIATAAFGSEFGTELDVLRWWRGNVLLKSVVGRWIVRAYYLGGPKIALLVKVSPKTRSAIRWVLRRVVMKIRKKHNLFD